MGKKYLYFGILLLIVGFLVASFTGLGVANVVNPANGTHIGFPETIYGDVVMALAICIIVFSIRSKPRPPPEIQQAVSTP